MTTPQEPAPQDPAGQDPAGENPARQDPADQNPAGQNPAGQDSTEATETPDRVAQVVMSHPCVVGLDGGPFGMIATHLARRQIVGVRAPETGQTWEVAVILRLDRPLPDIVAELREWIRPIAGPVPIDITVSDVLLESQG